MKLQIDECMWNGFDFYYFLARINQSSLKLRPDTRDYQEFFFAYGEGPFGRRPHYPNDPVDVPAHAYQPYFVCLRYKPVKRVEFGIEQSLAWQAGPVP